MCVCVCTVKFSNQLVTTCLHPVFTVLSALNYFVVDYCCYYFSSSFFFTFERSSFMVLFFSGFHSHDQKYKSFSDHFEDFYIYIYSSIVLVHPTTSFDNTKTTTKKWSANIEHPFTFFFIKTNNKNFGLERRPYRLCAYKNTH